MTDSILIVLFITAALAVTAWAIHYKRDRRILFTVMGVSLLFLGFWKSGCTCSPGSIQNVAMAFIDKNYKLSMVVFAIFIIPLIASFFWGRVFCSGVCPLGIIQDILNVVRINLPRWLRRVLGMVPVIYLAYILISLVSGTGFVLCKYDPYVHLFRFNITPGFYWFTVISIVITIVIYRPFCSFFCPYGLLLGWIGKFSRTSIEPTQMKCVTCNLCADACPVDAIEYGDKKLEEEKKFKVGKVGIIIILAIPLWIFLFGSAGRLIAHKSATVNVSIEKVETKITSLKEVIAKKEASGKSAEKLKIKVTENEKELTGFLNDRETIENKSFIVGAILGLYWGFMLLVLYEHRKKKGIHVDMAKCVTCGRCNNYCPGESKQEHKGITNFLVGHMKHRTEAHPHIKMAIVVTCAISLIVFLASTVVLQKGMKSADIITENSKNYATLYKDVSGKKATPELKAVYEKEQAEYVERLVESTSSRRNSAFVLVVSLLVFTGSLKYLVGKKEYSLVLKDLKKYRNKIHALNELLIFIGVLVLGFLVYILVQLLL